MYSIVRFGLIGLLLAAGCSPEANSPEATDSAEHGILGAIPNGFDKSQVLFVDGSRIFCIVAPCPQPVHVHNLAGQSITVHNVVFPTDEDLRRNVSAPTGNEQDAPRADTVVPTYRGTISQERQDQLAAQFADQILEGGLVIKGRVERVRGAIPPERLVVEAIDGPAHTWTIKPADPKALGGAYEVKRVDGAFTRERGRSRGRAGTDRRAGEFDRMPSILALLKNFRASLTAVDEVRVADSLGGELSLEKFKFGTTQVKGFVMGPGNSECAGLDSDACAKNAACTEILIPACDLCLGGTLECVPKQSKVVLRVTEIGDKVAPDRSPKCVVSGCNGEICAEESLFSICIALPGDHCFDDQTCVEKEGKCSWSDEAALEQCLAEAQGPILEGEPFIPRGRRGADCSVTECGPAPLVQCPDTNLISHSAECVRNRDSGLCGWTANCGELPDSCPDICAAVCAGKPEPQAPKACPVPGCKCPEPARREGEPARRAGEPARRPEPARREGKLPGNGLPPR